MNHLKTEIMKYLETMDESQLRMLLSFLKNLFKLD